MSFFSWVANAARSVGRGIVSAAKSVGNAIVSAAKTVVSAAKAVGSFCKKHAKWIVPAVVGTIVAVGVTIAAPFVAAGMAVGTAAVALGTWIIKGAGYIIALLGTGWLHSEMRSSEIRAHDRASQARLEESNARIEELNARAAVRDNQIHTLEQNSRQSAINSANLTSTREALRHRPQAAMRMQIPVEEDKSADSSPLPSPHRAPESMFANAPRDANANVRTASPVRRFS